MAHNFPVIAIVGRPNVGKSTLFNRIVGKRVAIVEDEPGVTRDRNYAVVERFSIPFLLVDTGGLDFESADEITKSVVGQSLVAAQEADKILVVFDAGEGYQNADREVMDALRSYKKKAVFVANKIDGDEQAIKAVDFYQLGLDDITDVSALHGRRVTSLIESCLTSLPRYADLLAIEKERKLREKELLELASSKIDPADLVDDFDESEIFGDTDDSDSEDDENPRSRAIVDPDHPFPEVFVSEHGEEGEDGEIDYLRANKVVPIHKRQYVDDADLDDGEAEEILPTVDVVRVAIVGRPNAGKSTLLNVLCGEQRAITSATPGTTRDALETEVTREGQRYVLVDTAGLRKQTRVEEGLERYAVTRSLQAISTCDIAVIMIDAAEGPSDQDAKIAGLAHEQGKGLVIVINKWDLVEKDHRTVKEYTERVFEQIRFAQYAPVLFTSAISGRRCVKVLDESLAIAVQRMRKVRTGKLNRIVRRALSRATLPFYRGRPIKLLYAAQIDTAPPRIALFMNYPRGVHFSVLRQIKNVIRKEFGFEGTDIKLVVTKRRDRVVANG